MREGGAGAIHRYIMKCIHDKSPYLTAASLRLRLQKLFLVFIPYCSTLVGGICVATLHAIR